MFRSLYDEAAIFYFYVLQTFCLSNGLRHEVSKVLLTTHHIPAL